MAHNCVNDMQPLESSPQFQVSPRQSPYIAQIRVRPHTLSFQRGYSVMATNLDGEMDGQNEHGLFGKSTTSLWTRLLFNLQATTRCLGTTQSRTPHPHHR